MGYAENETLPVGAMFGAFVHGDGSFGTSDEKATINLVRM